MSPSKPSDRPIPRIRQHPAWVLPIAALICMATGCGSLLYRLGSKEPDGFIPNPIELPMADDNFVWSQVVDAVDDYFRIAREQPVQHSRGLMLDGRLETTYQIGSTVFEPWRKDSTAGFERLQSTLQSIRRRAIVIVRPRPNGYSLEVIVQKDLEDSNRTGSVGDPATRDQVGSALVRQNSGYDDSPQTVGWIPLGRDQSLERVIVNDIFRRVTGA